MSNPRKPVETATLTEPAMLSPHESVELNTKRGLLAAVVATPRPIRAWCRSTTSQGLPQAGAAVDRAVARLGHESGFSEDGKTFYATGTAIRVDHGDRRDQPEDAEVHLAGRRSSRTA